MRYLVLGLGLGVALGFAWRALLGNEDTLDTWEAAEPPGASTTAPDVAPPPRAEPVPPAAADGADRESESRLDDESEHERSREDEERERAEAALRLQAEPFAWRREAGPDAEH